MRKLKLERSVERWAGMVPSVVIEGSQSQALFCITDAQKDIAALAKEVERLNAVLSSICADAIIAMKDSLQ